MPFASATTHHQQHNSKPTEGTANITGAWLTRARTLKGLNCIVGSNRSSPCWRMLGCSQRPWSQPRAHVTCPEPRRRVSWWSPTPVKLPSGAGWPWHPPQRLRSLGSPFHATALLDTFRISNNILKR